MQPNISAEISSPDALTAISEPALKYWATNGYTFDDIVSLGREIDEKRYAAIATFTPDRNLTITVSTRVGKMGQGHAASWSKFLQDVMNSWDGPPLNGSVLLWLEDGMMTYNRRYSERAPTLAVCREQNDHCTFLVPDPAYTGSQGYQEDLAKIDAVEASLSYESKTPTLFWRGAGSGNEIATDLWQEVQRVKFCLIAKEISDEKIDAKISKLIETEDPNVAQRVRDAGIVGDYLPFSEFLKFRYLLDIDGQCCAWISYFQKLYSKSLVFKADSEYLQWYYYWLSPWKHYIPLNRDFLSLERTYDWVRSNEASCSEMAQTSSSVMRSFTYQNTCKQTAKLLSTLFSFQKQ